MKLNITNPWKSINHLAKIAFFAAATSFAWPISKTFAQDPFAQKWYKIIQRQDKEEIILKDKLWDDKLFLQIKNLCNKAWNDFLYPNVSIEKLKLSMKSIMNNQAIIYISNKWNEKNIKDAIQYFSNKFRNNLNSNQRKIFDQNVKRINESIPNL